MYSNHFDLTNQWNNGCFVKFYRTLSIAFRFHVKRLTCLISHVKNDHDFNYFMGHIMTVMLIFLPSCQ